MQSRTDKISGNAGILAATFLVGFYAVLAQVTFTREMLVVFFGNELCIGTVLASWLVCIGLGSLTARGVLRGCPDARRLRRMLRALLAGMAVSLPIQVLAMRALRRLWGVPPGEYAAFHTIVGSSLVTFLPSCLAIGFFFPVAATLRGWRAAAPAGAASGRFARAWGEASPPVSAVYSVESAGSMLGGAALTYWLLPALSSARIVLLGSAAALLAAAALSRRRLGTWLLAAALILATGAGVGTGWGEALETLLVRTRWQAFGVTGGGESAPRADLRASQDTVYQNLAVIESGGQFTLYGNGQVMFVFPDPLAYEHSVHFIMAQNARAERVLLLGGNPVGDIPELLKYPLTRLVYVELDPGVGQLVRRALPQTYDAALADPRIECVVQDAPRFVQRCRERFDAVLVNAPEPTTAAANRYYTLEFFENVRRLLNDDGFLYTAVTSSERLQAEAANLGASVYRTLQAVFPVVLVTAETRNRFFAGRTAGGGEGGLTFDPEVLAERSRRAGVKTLFFRPEYFLGADELAAEKVALVRERFAEAEVPLNTSLRPVSYFHSLVLWTRFSGSSLHAALQRGRRLQARQAAGALLGLGGVLLAAGGVRRGRSAGWTRGMLACVVMSSGFCGMALEMLLILVFQSLYGYVYTRIALIVAVFMLGLVLGAPSGSALSAGGGRWTWLVLAACEILLLLCAAAIVPAVNFAGGAGGLGARSEALILLLVAAAGWAVGAEFPVCNRLYCRAGGAVGAGAAITHASDHVGAAVGSLLVGVLLVPVLGLGTAAGLLAALKGCGLLLVASAALALPAPSGR